MNTNLYKEGQSVIYKKTGQLMTILSWKFDGKPGGPLYLCSDGGLHREWNLTPATEVEVTGYPVEWKTESDAPHPLDSSEVEEPTDNIFEQVPIIPDNKDHALKRWGINTEMDLVQKAADFYITNEAATDFPVLKPQADAQAQLLADQFSAYLSMVIGGELRHTKTRAYSRWVSVPVLKILKEISNHSADHKHFSRNQAWYRWADIFQSKDRKQQTALIRTSRRIFRRGRWNRCYGGDNWSMIAVTLYNYLKGEYSATAFVDTVFGLYHNCNLVLDKVWNVDHLRRTLDDNFKHDMTALYQKCSPDTKGVVSIWRRFNNEL